MKVWIDGALHYLGALPDRAAAADYVRLVESRYPDRLRRPGGTISRRTWKNGRVRFITLGPRPQRERLGELCDPLGGRARAKAPWYPLTAKWCAGDLF
jgi:hypothetical protein